MQGSRPSSFRHVSLPATGKGKRGKQAAFSLTGCPSSCGSRFFLGLTFAVGLRAGEKSRGEVPRRLPTSRVHTPVKAGHTQRFRCCVRGEKGRRQPELQGEGGRRYRSRDAGAGAAAGGGPAPTAGARGRPPPPPGGQTLRETPRGGGRLPGGALPPPGGRRRRAQVRAGSRTRRRSAPPHGRRGCRQCGGRAPGLLGGGV